jgi:hypothetical protein
VKPELDMQMVLLFTPRLKDTWTLLFLKHTGTLVNDTGKGDAAGDEHFTSQEYS